MEQGPISSLQVCPFGPGTPTRNTSSEASLTFIDIDSTEYWARLKLIDKGVMRTLVAAISPIVRLYGDLLRYGHRAGTITEVSKTSASTFYIILN